MDDMKNFGLWAQVSKHYDQLKTMVHMNNFRLWA